MERSILLKQNVHLLKSFWCPDQELPINHTDIDFICRDGKISGHQQLLRNCCTNLDNMLQVSAQQDVATVLLPDFRKSTAHQLLQFIYTGTVTLKNNSDFEQLTHLGLNQLGFNLNFEWNSTFKTQGCDVFNLSLRDPAKKAIAKPCRMLRSTTKELTTLTKYSPKPTNIDKPSDTVPKEKNPTIAKDSKSPSIEKDFKNISDKNFSKVSTIEKISKNPSNESASSSTTIEKVLKSPFIKSKNPVSKLSLAKAPLTRASIRPLISSILNETDELSYKKKVRKLINKKNAANLLSCSLCHYKNASRCSIFFHIEAKHLKTKRYQCNFCEIKVTNRRSLWMHTSNSHRDEQKIFKESFPKNGVQNQLTFDDNSDTAELVDPLFQEDIFKAEIKTEQSLAEQLDPEEYQTKVNAQITEDLEDNTYSCKICHLKKKSKTTVFRHIESKHLKAVKYQCNYCGILRANRGALGAHISSKHKGQSGTFLPADSNEIPEEILIDDDPLDFSMLETPSDIENDSYNNNTFAEGPTGLDIKMLVKAGPTNGTFICVICDKVSTRRYKLQNHVKAKHVKKCSFSCKLCADSFSSYKALKIHLRECTPLFGPTMHSLNESDESFESPDLVISKEIKLLVQQGPLKGLYTCSICQKTDSRKKELYQHILKQHKSKSEFNQFSSHSKDNFKSISIESNEKIDYNARVNAYIAKDMKKETYFCRVCPLVRPRKGQIFSHIEAKHLKIKRYSCESCSYKLNSKPSLVAHMKAKHNNNLKATTQDPLVSEATEEMEIQELEVPVPKIFS